MPGNQQLAASGGRSLSNAGFELLEFVEIRHRRLPQDTLQSTDKCLITIVDSIVSSRLTNNPTLDAYGPFGRHPVIPFLITRI
jgi:hypothetical protein